LSTLYTTPTLTTSRAYILVFRAAAQRQLALWARCLPTIRPFYAVKSNPDPTLLKWLRKGGVGVDCASPAEMRLALKAGFKREDILYANTMKAPGDLKEAYELGTQITTTDSVEGVDQLRAYPMTALVRLAVDDSAARSPFSIKFGARQEEWRAVYARMRRTGVRFGGVSFHVGSGGGSVRAWADAIGKCREFQQAVGGVPIPTLDIGGGFLPNAAHFMEVAGHIRRALEGWNREGNAPSRVIAEPGRFFSAPTQTVVAPVVFKKEDAHTVRYLLDDSVYGQFNNIVYDHAAPAWYTKAVKPRTTKTAMFFGKTCDSLDFIALQHNAPVYDIGEKLYFPWMGAYTSCSATAFNGFPLAKKYYLDYTIAGNEKVMQEAALPAGVEIPIETVSRVALSSPSQLR
jgi:ornithine decarboxylase